MLNEIIRNLKETVPDALVDVSPQIPKEVNNPEIVNIRQLYPEISDSNFPPTVFLNPNAEILYPDNELEKEISGKGIEALAWYLSFHQSSKWGIYIRARGLFYLSHFFKKAKSVNEKIKEAFDLLFYHEYFHFLSDMTSANIEMIYKKTVYNKYVTYLGTDWNIEEPLANVYALKKMPKKYYPSVEIFFKTQPSPYRYFADYLSEQSFALGKRELGAIMHSLHETNSDDEVKVKIGGIRILKSAKGFPDNQSPFWEFLFNVEPEVTFIPQVPIFLVFEDHPNGKLKFQSPIMHSMKIAVYPNDHLPPHIHVWIPGDARKEEVYEYPSLTPYRKSKPLSSKKKRVLEEFIMKYKNKIELELQKASPYGG